jgi:hypothetical protein
VVLPYLADWRWMDEREDSPWYPTARLFRQKAAGDWSGPVAAMEGELRSEVARREGSPDSNSRVWADGHENQHRNDAIIGTSRLPCAQPSLLTTS